MVTRVWMAAACGLAALGCRGSIEPDQTASWSNAGRLCVGSEAERDAMLAGDEPNVTLEADGDLVVVVTMSDCESCTSGLSASCSVTGGANDVFTVTSSAGYRVVDGDCPADCAIVSAACEVTNVPAGSYSVQHGGDLLTIELPYSGAAPCTGETMAPEISP